MKELFSYILFFGVVMPPVCAMMYGTVQLAKNDKYINFVWCGLIMFIFCTIGLLYGLE